MSTLSDILSALPADSETATIRLCLAENFNRMGAAFEPARKGAHDAIVSAIIDFKLIHRDADGAMNLLVWAGGKWWKVVHPDSGAPVALTHEFAGKRKEAGLIFDAALVIANTVRHIRGAR